ncbi:lipopolysaccharide biosynthesis protein [Rheinheimera sp. MMS21-TC3]|uniref:lipopolysaccharide biosynthesis protein n=1 Tax=Rheinheimera sp. MMS21-TC3 TaxID=3072790 RepID=UPI0028C4BCFF|nr:oligosaccharide flippase family protein [Rheinheimera sp. MMS21-TC3]WNO61677.1 oligosaccharide flippase family protein [Rheinheimera sp. MMS21-TC3]
MLFKHSILYFLARLGPAIITLLALSVYTRLLTPEDYGFYSLTIVVAMGLNTIVFQWISLALGRFLPEVNDARLKKQWVSTAVYSWLCIALIISVATYFLPLDDYLSQFSVIFSIVGILAAGQGWFALALRFDNIALRPVRYGIASLIKSGLALLLGGAALHFGLDVRAVLMMLLIALLLSSLLQRSEWANSDIRFFDKSIFIKMLVYGMPLTMTFVMTFLIDASGRFFIAKYQGPAEVGVFSASFEFIQYIIGTLLGIIHLAAFPLIISKLNKEGEIAARKQLVINFELLLAVAAASCVGLALLSADVAALFMGENFRAGANTLMPWLALALFLSVIRSYYFDYAFQLGSNTVLQFYTVAVGALVNIIACIILIPICGLSGAAVAICYGFAASLVTSIVLGKYAFVMPALPKLAIVKVAFAICCMVLAIVQLPVLTALWALILKTLVGGAVFISVMIMMNYMNVRQLLKERYFARGA